MLYSEMTQEQKILAIFEGMEFKEARAVLDKALINRQLVVHYGNQTKAARSLNMNRATLRTIMNKKRGE